MISERSSYWRLSGFYWFYFAALGALLPYWGLYLSAEGYSALEIGELMAVIMATKIVAPNIWGWLADHFDKRLLIIQLGSLLAALGYAGVFVVSGYWWLFFVMMLFSFFWNAVLPQFEALTFNHLGDQSHRYSWIRIWGSIGFIVTAMVIGLSLTYIDIKILPYIIFGILVGIWLNSLIISDHQGSRHTEIHQPLAKVVNNKKVLALLLACLLVQASHGPYYTFYSIYLESHHYSSSYIGVLWAVGVIAEVVAFAFMPYLVTRFGLKNLLLASLLSGTLRWLMVGYFVDNIVITTFAQIFHASTFGIYHAVAIAYIHRYFKGKNQGQGQALYSSISFGIGGAIGSLYCGYMWDSLGPTLTYTMAALISLSAFILSFKYAEN